MSAKPPKILDPLRVRLRRLQFTMGLGFISLVIGSVFASAFTYRVYERSQDLPYFLYMLLVVALSNLWVVGVLPVLCYGAARVLEIKPMSTAMGAAFTGQFFVLAVQTASSGVEGLWNGWMAFTMQVAAFFGGVGLSYRSVVQGRAAASKSAAQVQAKAEARKSEYDEFLREAEKAGEKVAQREAERTTAAAPGTGAVVEAPAAAAAPVSAAPAEAPAAATEAPAAPAATPSPEAAPTQEAPAEPKASTGS